MRGAAFMLTKMRAPFVLCALVAALIAGSYSTRAQSITTPGCFNIVTTLTSVATTSCTTPTAPPTVAPTPPPTPNPGTFQGFINGQPYPAGFKPFPSSAPFSSPLPAISPGYYTSDSATIVAEQWSQGTNSFGQAIHDAEPGSFDTSFPVYISSVNDPVVNFVSPVYGNALNTTGGILATANVPAKGFPTQSQPGYLSNFTIFQPSGVELDLNVTSNGSPATMNPPNGVSWTNGSTMQITSYGAACSNFYNGTGIGAGTVGTTSSGICGAAGLVGINDLQRGEIDHTLVVYPNCVVAGSVFPARLAQNVQICTDGVGPEIGYTMWYDVACSTTQATNAQPWLKAVLCALNQYGGIVAGTQTWGGTVGAGAGNSSGQFGFSIGLESSEPFLAYGQGDKWALMFNQGWVGFTTSGYAPGFQRWYARPQDASGNTIPSPAVDFAGHMHYLKNCVKAQNC